MTFSKLTRLQIAAGLIGDLADTVDALGKQLDRLREEIGEDLFSRVEQAFPIHVQFGPETNSKLVKLMRELPTH